MIRHEQDIELELPNSGDESDQLGLSDSSDDYTNDLDLVYDADDKDVSDQSILPVRSHQRDPTDTNVVERHIDHDEMVRTYRQNKISGMTRLDDIRLNYVHARDEVTFMSTYGIKISKSVLKYTRFLNYVDQTPKLTQCPKTQCKYTFPHLHTMYITPNAATARRRYKLANLYYNLKRLYCPFRSKHWNKKFNWLLLRVFIPYIIESQQPSQHTGVPTPKYICFIINGLICLVHLAPYKTRQNKRKFMVYQIDNKVVVESLDIHHPKRTQST
jgi:hypothetical protein